MTRALFLLPLLAACADIPQVGRAEAMLANPGDTPPLLTANELAAVTTAAPDRANALGAEAAALQARARRLRQR